MHIQKPSKGKRLPTCIGCKSNCEQDPCLVTILERVHWKMKLQGSNMQWTLQRSIGVICWDASPTVNIYLNLVRKSPMANAIVGWAWFLSDCCIRWVYTLRYTPYIEIYTVEYSVVRCVYCFPNCISYNGSDPSDTVRRSPAFLERVH
jgi:hypothetical protein